MEQENYAQVKANFGANAHEYTISKGHADERTLAQVVAKTAPQLTDRLLDIGTGAGHTAIAFAPRVASVIAYDLTPQMLEETAKNAAAKGITNLTTRQGAAEKLPFAESSFEIVSCRLTTHHFANLKQAMTEMARVLVLGGKLIIVDTSVPENPELDRQINEIEILRDPSHVRNYSGSEWRELYRQAGLSVELIEQGYYDEGERMDFDNWTQRMKTPLEKVVQLQKLFRAASPALQEALKIDVEDEKIYFALPRILILGRKV